MEIINPFNDFKNVMIISYMFIFLEEKIKHFEHPVTIEYYLSIPQIADLAIRDVTQ